MTTCTKQREPRLHTNCGGILGHPGSSLTGSGAGTGGNGGVGGGGVMVILGLTQLTGVASDIMVSSVIMVSYGPVPVLSISRDNTKTFAIFKTM